MHNRKKKNSIGIIFHNAAFFQYSPRLNFKCPFFNRELFNLIDWQMERQFNFQSTYIVIVFQSDRFLKMRKITIDAKKTVLMLLFKNVDICENAMIYVLISKVSRHTIKVRQASKGLFNSLFFLGMFHVFNLCIKLPIWPMQVMD